MERSPPTKSWVRGKRKHDPKNEKKTRCSLSRSRSPLNLPLVQPPPSTTFHIHLHPKKTVFSKSYCPYCVKAKDAIKSALGQPGIAATVVWELDERDDGAAIQSYLGTKTGASTVPRVFIGGKFLGGGEETARAARDGTLVKLAKEAGVAV